MKLWVNHCSEHSMNLVMIGRFKDATGASEVIEIVKKLEDQVFKDAQTREGDSADRYTDSMLDLLGDLNIRTLGPAELEQFAYDVDVEVKGNEVVVTTEEIDVSAFLKVLIEKGARIEIYSAHDYPGTGYGRGE